MNTLIKNIYTKIIVQVSFCLLLHIVIRAQELNC